MKLKNNSAIILGVASLSLVVTYFLPLWRIDLWAPQYPEGLAMFIWLNKLSGDVDIINGLNHYIGMEHIKEEMFPEFKILPYIVGFYLVYGLLTAILRSRKMLISYLILIMLAGVVALYDFWQWGYEYGHNLRDDAAIKVPGMAYQPPLIGYKELLNFGAYSMPDAGGWVFIAVGVTVAILVFYEFYWLKKVSKVAKKSMMVLVLLGVGIAFQACSQATEPIRYGKDACHFCKMTIMDKKYGCEIVTDKGKVFKFDDVSCMAKYLKDNNLEQSRLSFIVVNQYDNPGELIDAKSAVFLNGSQIRSPMRGDMAAFTNQASAEKAKANLGEVRMFGWKEIVSHF